MFSPPAQLEILRREEMGDFLGRKCFFQRRRNVEAQGKIRLSDYSDLRAETLCPGFTQDTHLAQPRANYLRPDNPSSPALSYSLHSSTKISTFFLCPYQKEKVSLPQISGNGFVPHCILPYTTSTIHRFSKTSATKKFPPHSFCNNTTIINNKLNFLTQ